MGQDDLIKDLVDKAGGLTENASIDQTNLADQLSNHQVITIHHYLDLLDEKAAEVKGCVNQPGVYYFYQEIRIIDLIQMAGGFNNLADYSDINLSDVVKDTDVIIIPEIENEETIAVDLKGEVKYPGVYYLKEGSRVIDLLHLAGGLRPEADTTDINFSRLLVDEDVIEIKKIENTIDYIYVEIKGQVFLPGIYALEPGTRLVMLLNRAGGLTNSADDSLLNRTRILEDGEVIVIPSINEEHIWIRITGGVFDPGVYQVPLETSILDLIEVAGGLTIEADMDQIDFSVTFNENTSIHIPLIDETNPGLPNQSDGLININIASLEELQTLTGIGIILAERIIAYRESNGPFDSIENIMDVSGIGESIYENIKDDITV
jgi:competence protein ComEA